MSKDVRKVLIDAVQKYFSYDSANKAEASPLLKTRSLAQSHMHANSAPSGKACLSPRRRSPGMCSASPAVALRLDALASVVCVQAYLAELQTSGRYLQDVWS
jgi:hypothetical protein